MKTVVDQLPRLRKRELICLLLFTCNYVVSVWRGFLFLLVLGMGYVILLALPEPSYNYFINKTSLEFQISNALMQKYLQPGMRFFDKFIVSILKLEMLRIDQT